jgi:hypothetical protein
LIKLVEFCPHDFDFKALVKLHFQMECYINDVSKDENFTNLRSLTEISMMLVKTDRILRYHIIYKLLKLVLVLPVATAGVERVFSSMKFIKNKLRSKMGQRFLNGCFVTFIERDFLQVRDDGIITSFQAPRESKS